MDSLWAGVHAIAIRGSGRHSGKTTIGTALGRWLWQHGVHVAPLHLSSPGDWDRVPCPEGGEVSRPAALLSEACGIHAETAFEGGIPALPSLARRFDLVLIEEADGEPAGIPAEKTLKVSRAGRSIQLDLPSRTVHLEGRRLMALEQGSEEILALPAWTFGGAPRTCVISLPHMVGFEDYSLVRGAEWLTMPGIGLYDMIFLPESEDPATDLAWMEERGLCDWLLKQRSQGARVFSSGMMGKGYEPVSREALRHPNTLAVLTGVRWPFRAPDESELASLADWLERAAGELELKRLLP